MPGTFSLNKLYKPMQALHLDCIKLSKIRDGYTLAIIAICGMSKWVEVRSMKTNNSTKMRNFLFDKIICRYGCPIMD